jgi:hypothetical protein
MPPQEAPNRVELRHFFVTPGVAAAHALSGLAIFAGAESVLKTTPLYLLGLIVHKPIQRCYYPDRDRRSCNNTLFYARAASKMILPQRYLLLMHLMSAGVAIMAGQYHDGYVPNGGSAFIFADQIRLLMVVVVHTLEYIEAL